jgi:tetratricopeptide (TPR) repeat protein
MNIIDKAKTLKANGNIDEAINMLKKYIIENPKDDVGAYRYLALFYLKINEKEKGAEILLSGVSNNPENLWLKIMLGDFYYFELNELIRPLPYTKTY